MDNLKSMVDKLLKIENIDEIRFKAIEINPQKTIYFIFHEQQQILNEEFISGSIEPEAFILKMDEEYYYCPLNDEKFDEHLVEEFAKNL